MTEYVTQESSEVISLADELHIDRSLAIHIINVASRCATVTPMEWQEEKGLFEQSTESADEE